MKFQLKLSLFLPIFILFFAALAIVTMPKVNAGAGGSPNGGSPGCGTTFSTCYGATWRYYTTTSNDVSIANVRTPPAARTYTHVTNCASTGGFFAYVLVDPAGSSDVRSWTIGSTSDNGDRSQYFGGGTNYYRGDDGSDPLPAVLQNGVGYTWNAVNGAFNKTVALGQNNGFAWNASSTLSWFCYRGLDFNLTPTITGTPAFTDGDSGGSDKATLTPIVTNAGPTGSSNASWKVVSFIIPKGSPVPGGGDSSSAPETFYGNGAIAVASGSQQFSKGPTGVSVGQQAIGDFVLGTRICYALSVAPITQDNGNWRHSTPFCVIIAKAPKFQVWGGDIRAGAGFTDQPATGVSTINASQTTKYR
ncbi:MAG: hypothetical protein JWM52_425 [Candidatus Saccharibacteria bacterium]|nr:hypothetical protein [Candidatus Saccharibacteria bacterium]